MALASFALVLPLLTPTVSAPEHGELPWFEGTYSELIKAAKEAQKPVMIDFWTTYCGWCKKLDRDTFSDESVLAAMEGFLVWNVNAETPEGRRLVKRFKITTYPSLVFVDPDGSPRDLIRGYLPPDAFKVEAERLLRNEDTISGYEARIKADPGDLDARIGLVKKYEQFGDILGRQKQLREIKRLDPEGKTLAGEYGLLEGEKNEILAIWNRTREIDTSRIERFLGKAKHAEVRYQGWTHIANTRHREAQQLTGRVSEKRLSELRSFSRTAFEKAWADCPESERARDGVQMILVYCETYDMTAEQARFVLGAARSLTEFAPEDPPVWDALATAEQVAGERKAALAAIRRCIELEPDNKRWTKRLQQLEGS
jgi:thiol-disulfide isomerase/thioredoxin